MSAATAESAQELRARLDAERSGLCFLRYLTADAGQRLHLLDDPAAAVSIGRGEEMTLRLQRDPEVSRLHAELRAIGGHWVLADDGLSRNGTYVNGRRIHGRRRLRDGDVVRCGSTELIFSEPATAAAAGTLPADDVAPPVLTETQTRVLRALCRPLCGGEFAAPASNAAIAEEAHLSLGGVKRTMRGLFARLEIDPALPQNRKRLRLAERAVESGLVLLRELESGAEANSAESRSLSPPR